MNIIEGTITDPTLDPALNPSSITLQQAKAQWDDILALLEAPELGSAEYIGLLKRLHVASALLQRRLDSGMLKSQAPFKKELH